MAGARRLGKGQLMQIRRRSFLGQMLLALAGLSRRVAAQAGPRFRPLARPVVVTLDGLATPWRARPFTADGVTLSSAASPNQPVRIAGLVVRTSEGGNQPDRFAAVCARCPHEGCDVDFVPDPSQLPQEVKDEIGHAVPNGVYICPCHNSTFKADDGERLAGPAPRGLYRFRVTASTDAAVEIAEVEEDALIFL